jgi:hypothetical protein
MPDGFEDKAFKLKYYQGFSVKPFEKRLTIAPGWVTREEV